MAESLNIAILGGGAWGTALACVMARRGHEATLWARDPATVAGINEAHINASYLPGIALPVELTATPDLKTSLKAADMVLLSVPAQSVTTMAETLAGVIDPAIPVVLCAKGIDRDSAKLPAEILAGIMPQTPLAAMSGPSFAADVARNLPTAVTLAAGDMGLARLLAAQLSGAAFRVYASDDLTGVELGGALKNVIALAVGVCRGMGLGASAEAALIARGFAELSRLATALGARHETLTGLSGLGDLVLTCSSTQSRNFSYGIALGKSQSTKDMQLAEGAFTAGVAARMAEEHAIDCPIIATAAKLVDHSITPREALGDLINRPLKTESE